LPTFEGSIASSSGAWLKPEGSANDGVPLPLGTLAAADGLASVDGLAADDGSALVADDGSALTGADAATLAAVVAAGEADGADEPHAATVAASSTVAARAPIGRRIVDISFPLAADGLEAIIVAAGLSEAGRAPR
jgi:hypothetical protein